MTKNKRTYQIGKERIAKKEEMHYLKRAEQCLEEARGLLDQYLQDKGPALEKWQEFKRKFDQAKRLYHRADFFNAKAEHHITKQLVKGVSE
jgi:hypothetical protein